MKYITLFEQQTAFDNAKSTLDKPNMSLVTETGNVYSLAVGGGVTYEYVDLGLSVKWAKCNIGAKTETEYGDYFMWGSTRPNTTDECTSANTPFNDFDSVKDTVCPNGILAKKYDAAAQIMGGDWRMPTSVEFDDLIGGTTNEWMPNYNGTGVNGYKFTASNGNSIFIPAAGYYADGSASNVGNGGYVWSSSNYTSPYFPNFAWGLSFSSDVCANGGFNRYYGLPVRGVL